MMDKLAALDLKFLQDAFNRQAATEANVGVVNSLVTRIVDVLAVIAAAAAVIMLVYSGIQYIAAGANAEQATKARGGIVNSLIGLGIVIFSYVLVRWLVTRIS